MTLSSVSSFSWYRWTLSQKCCFQNKMSSACWRPLQLQHTFYSAGIFMWKYFVTISKEIAHIRRRTRRYKRYDEMYFDDYAWPFYEQYRDKLIIQHRNLVMIDSVLDLNVNLICNLEGIKKLMNWCYFLSWLKFYAIHNFKWDVCIINWCLKKWVWVQRKWVNSRKWKRSVIIENDYRGLNHLKK